MFTPMASDRFDSDDRDDRGNDREGSFRRSRDRWRDEDRGGPRGRRRDDDRGRFRDRRDDDRGRSRDRTRPRDRYDDDYRGDRYDDRRDRGSYSRDRSRRCNHCDRCPVHGSRSVREYPSDKFKVVFDNIPQCSVSDIEALCRDNGLEPVFSKITRNTKHAIVEFKNFEDRDAAIEKLDKAELLGCAISVREFRASGSAFGDSGERSSNAFGQPTNKDYDDDNDANEGGEKRRRVQEGEDIYADIEEQKPEKGEFDV